jgi:hypothetical protein
MGEAGRAGGNRDYSGTPLPKKLGISEGSRVLVAGAPKSFALPPLPTGVELVERARSPLDVVLLFVTTRSDLSKRFAAPARALAPAGRLWVAWPKKASGITTDLTFGVVQGHGLEAGLVDNKSASIDERYQGLQFVYRIKDRPGRSAGGSAPSSGRSAS